jgi:hypothetical protein
MELTFMAKNVTRKDFANAIVPDSVFTGKGKLGLQLN